MRRLLLTVAAAALLAPAAAHADLCSPLHKTCASYSIAPGGNPVYLRIRTFEPITQYKLCVTDPTNHYRCAWSRLTADGTGAGVGSVRYTGAYIGAYHARWYRTDGTLLAPYWWWPSGLTFAIYQ